ncbi:MAG: heme NO-binding domain-containing protein [Alphaproteobacteria bacterium]
MIGIVNNAFHDYVLEHHGPETWLRIAEQVGTSVFIGTEEYDDRTTTDLAGALGREVGLAPEVVLERVGEHFGRQCAGRDFGVLLNAGGATYRDFLRGLPDLQTRFGLIYPNTRPPRFAVEDTGPDSVTIVHFTSREGLSPLLAGVLAGLASVFGMEAAVTRSSRGSGDGRCYVFQVAWRPRMEAPRPPAPRRRREDPAQRLAYA